MNSSLFRYCFAFSRNVFWIILRRIQGYEKFNRKKYYHEKIGNFDYANHLIEQGILGDEPFMVARFGDTELRTVVYTLEKQLGIRKKFPTYIKEKMQVNAGFFPSTDENLEKFGELMLESCKEINVIGVWYNLMEDYIIHYYAKSAKCVKLDGLAPYMSNEPWSRALKGKKVLVIHPFSESIKKQYSKKDKLFSNKDILPEFDLITLKAVQSAAGEMTDFDDWFEALEYMYNEAIKIDFEIAII